MAQNPIIFADVPDVSMIRQGDTYYMSSTTMHLSPGLPIMKSKDLVNWELVNYAYERLGDVDALNLENGEQAYGRGSWASSLRFNKGVFYVTTFSASTGKTHIFYTKDIEQAGPWKEIAFAPSLHDNSLFFDDDGKAYLIWGAGKLMMAQLKDDLSGIKEGTERVLIENASLPAGDNINLAAEGSQLFKVHGKYYLFNITWPKNGMRTVLIHRADTITGPYEGRLALQNKGVAQGGLIDTPDGQWFSYLFRDYGAVGRIPYLVPVHWEDGWPVLGEDGKVPDTLQLPPNRPIIPGIVASDDFNRDNESSDLPLVWQWNHNPVDTLWSLTERKGFLRLTTARKDTSLLTVKNILTQRTLGPESTGTTAIDVSKMKNGDVAGLMLLQKNYGYVGVVMSNDMKYVVISKIENDTLMEKLRVPLNQDTVYLKAYCDFRDKIDKASFSYSLDGTTWNSIGEVLNMKYTLPHFMGYRFGLFNQATIAPGGSIDFDYFNIFNSENQ
ncbi:MAG: glycoside hydrolase 43 family protein [Leeuwenhoekiella sp.]